MLATMMAAGVPLISLCRSSVRGMRMPVCRI
jgi:hypothetical protein